jgi:cardiolipin synthase
VLRPGISQVASQGFSQGFSQVALGKPVQDTNVAQPLTAALPRDITNRLQSRSHDTSGNFGVALLNLPNLVTLARILLVPVVVWAIGSGQWQIAFLVFLIAGVSDAVDGFLAKRFGMTSELGAHLDPLADKALIVSIYIALGISEAIPRWLVILVVSRDILIVGGVMLAWFVDKPMRVKPLIVSKLNTVAQISLACLVLGSLAFGLRFEPLEYAVMAAVAALTLASIGAYVREWLVHMSAPEANS